MFQNDSWKHTKKTTNPLLAEMKARNLQPYLLQTTLCNTKVWETKRFYVNSVMMAKITWELKAHIPLPLDICGNSKELPLNLQKDLNYFLESSYFLFPFYFKSAACPSRPGTLLQRLFWKKTTTKQKQTKNTNKTL